MRLNYKYAYMVLRPLCHVRARSKVIIYLSLMLLVQNTVGSTLQSKVISNYTYSHCYDVPKQMSPQPGALILKRMMTYKTRLRHLLVIFI